MSDQGWADTVIWWHVYPLGFVGAQPRAAAADAADAPDLAVQHRLPKLVGWLDYLLQLGANGLLLGPVFASTSHGYDTLDHYRVDPRLGDEGDLRELFDEARQRGVRVLLDGVFNHLSADHPVVLRALRQDASPQDRAWLRWVGEHPRGFEGNLDLVELDLTHPPVQDYVVEVMDYWLLAGADGWRLDAAYAPGAGAWRPIIERVRERHPHCWILGEVIHGDYLQFVQQSGVDSVTQYELWKAIWSSLNDTNLHELAWGLKRHAEFCAAFLPQTFIGNHDTTRIATKLTHPAHLGMAIALSCLLPGVPSVYAGDEQGFTGEKLDQPGGDDAVRPPFPDHPEELASVGAAVLREYRQVIHLRRTHPWLATATATAREVTNETMTIDLVGAPGPEADRRLTLGLNLTDEVVELETQTGPLAIPAHGWALA
ncbi:MAG: alpha-amylase family glycosyl hydrolase [Ornithinimicrobium sp.]|uniref:alpha-amylase family glycosyl hydrolase n=1 Tax=Ornithinimicrobium sp. TaxID=1977084 RepID=UPI0026DFBC3A|nr:alpha-amylase family glycosyl hydrolase [Ornithinimicrobium sp.]MDO5739340.1 alpha-amylase family glycosyl hydrolase [Ornithinimicrobium sp.]